MADLKTADLAYSLWEWKVNRGTWVSAEDDWFLAEWIIQTLKDIEKKEKKEKRRKVYGSRDQTTAPQRN